MSWSIFNTASGRTARSTVGNTELLATVVFCIVGGIGNTELLATVVFCIVGGIGNTTDRIFQCDDLPVSFPHLIYAVTIE